MFDVTNSFNNKIFAKALHTYFNYDEIAHETHKVGGVMKEDKDHYLFIILSSLENRLRGKSQEEIELLISLCQRIEP